MTLDIELFRAEKGGDPKKIRDSQRKRYKVVVDSDEVVERMRNEKYIDDQLKRVKNACDKATEEKIKQKDAGGDAQFSEELKAKRLEQLTLDDIKTLSNDAIKELSNTIDKQIAAIKEICEPWEVLEVVRPQTLSQLRNVVHPSVPVSDDEANNVTERTFGDVSKSEVKPCEEKPSIKPSDEDKPVVSSGEKPEIKPCEESPVPVNSIEPRGDKPAPVPLNSITSAHPIRRVEVPNTQLSWKVRSNSNRPSPPNNRYQSRPPSRRDDRQYTPQQQQQQQQPPRGPEHGKDDGGVSDVTTAMSGMGMREGDNRMPSKPVPQRVPNPTTINTNRPGGFSGSAGFHKNSSIGRGGGGGGGYGPPRGNYNGNNRQTYFNTNPRYRDNNQYVHHQNRPPYNQRGNQYPPPNNAYPPMNVPYYPPPFAFPGYPSPPGYMHMPMPPMTNLPFIQYQGADQVPAAMPGLPMPVPDNRQIIPGAKCEVFASDRKYYPATVLGPLNPANNSVLISFDATGFHANVHISTLKFATGG